MGSKKSAEADFLLIRFLLLDYFNSTLSHINFLTEILRDPASRFLPFVLRTQTKTSLRPAQKHKTLRKQGFVLLCP